MQSVLLSRLKFTFNYTTRSIHAQRIGEIHSNTTLVFVNYKTEYGTVALKKEFKCFLNKHHFAEASAIYICASSSKKVNEHIDRLGEFIGDIDKHQLCEVTLEIPFSKSNIWCHEYVSTAIKVVKPNRINLKILHPTDIFYLVEKGNHMSPLWKNVFRQGLSADIMLPCFCEKLETNKFLIELQKCCRHFSHIVLEQSTCLQHSRTTCDENFIRKYELSKKVFRRNGFYEYKFCHFAKSEHFKSLYMTLLSRGSSYVGLGSGSHSRLDSCNHGNVVRVGYKNCAFSLGPVAYVLPQLDCLAEILLLGLDTVDGVSAEIWRKYSNGHELEEVARLEMVKRLITDGLLLVTSHTITVPKKHWVVLHSIVNEILMAIEELHWFN